MRNCRNMHPTNGEHKPVQVESRFDSRHCLHKQINRSNFQYWLELRPCPAHLFAAWTEQSGRLWIRTTQIPSNDKQLMHQERSNSAKAALRVAEESMLRFQACCHNLVETSGLCFFFAWYASSTCRVSYASARKASTAVDLATSICKRI